jgi:acyl carrier protein
MDRNQFVAALENVLQINKGTLKPETSLEGLDHWDSMGMLEFQAMADEDFGVQLDSPVINSCKTVEDLWTLVLGGKNS